MKFTQTLKLVIAVAVASQLASWTMAADYQKKTDRQTQGTSSLSKKEVNFINDAAEGGLMEVQMGQLAQQKAQSSDAKSLGQKLVTDHQKAGDELKQIASTKGVTVPSQLPPKHQKMVDKLSNASDFDNTCNTSPCDPTDPTQVVPKTFWDPNDSNVAYGQNGLQVIWHRIIYPDASSIDLSGMIGQDAQGSSGFRSEVDNHYQRLVGFAVLSSLFSAGFQLSQSHRASVLQNPSAGEIAAGAVGQEVSQVGAQITRRNLNIQPTIKIPIGYKFNVRVNRDILFESPYKPH